MPSCELFTRLRPRPVRVLGWRLGSRGLRSAQQLPGGEAGLRRGGALGSLILSLPAKVPPAALRETRNPPVG